MEIIDGKLFERMVLGGLHNLHNNVQIVNDLNVFPIPDGDTGENMYSTLKGGVDELINNTCSSISDKACLLAKGMLLGARGNSGVILSQLFYGLSLGLEGREVVSIYDFLSAMEEGVKCAYSSVSSPVEGTILTVAREAVAGVNKLDIEDVDDFLGNLVKEMKLSLERTPLLLDVLKEAGVIDSGGAGLLYIVEGFYKSLTEEVELDKNIGNDKKSIDFSKFDENSVMEFGYCTEALVRLQRCKCDIDNFNVDKLIDFLNSIGDSVVAFKTGSIVKLHVHTLTPWKVLAHCQEFGEFLTTKIENMTLQHNELVKKEEPVIKVKRARRKYAVIVCASGDGIIEMFKDIGADYVVKGGQTDNPSTDDFIKAFDEVNADYVFVLPNNSNIILAANQAKEMYKDSDIRVIQTKNVGEGYSALSMLDYSSDDVDVIEDLLRDSYKDVVTGMISKSIRDVTINDVVIHKDWYMGFTGKTMLASCQDKLDTVKCLLDKMDIKNKSFLIVVYGVGASLEQRSIFKDFVCENYDSVELYEIDGKQEVYDFILIAE